MVGCYALLLLWFVSIAVTDRSLTLQFFWWFNQALVLAALGLLLLATLLRWIAAFGEPSSTVSVPRRSLARRTAGLAFKPAAAVTLCLLILGARELGVFRWIGGLGGGSPTQGTAIRVVHWNMSDYDVAPGVDIGERLSAAGTPDVLLINMQNNPRLWKQIEEGMKRNPAEKILMSNLGGYKVFSRFPITVTGVHSVPFTGDSTAEVAQIPGVIRSTMQWGFRVLQLHRRSTAALEPALLIGLSFDTVAVNGRPTRAWFIDMPSNPALGRDHIVRRVRARAEQLEQQGSLPHPDFIAGDFNIPLGSESLRVYAPGFSPASATAGLGRLASWPRPKPVLQLDHILVSPAWRVSDYQLLDPGGSEHMAQTAIIWPADTSPSTGAPK